MSFKSAADILGGVRNPNYTALLERDEWKQFSKSIREARGNACEICKRGNIEVQVHHFAYYANQQPWESDPEDVALLCKGCHKQIHVELSRFRRFVFRKLTPQSFCVLNGALAVGLDHHDPLELAYAIAEMAASPDSVKRFCAAFVNSEPSQK